MRANGSPLPIFETDEDRLSLLVRLRVHPDAPAPPPPQVPPKSPRKSPPPQVKEPIDDELSKLGDILGVATAQVTPQVTALLRTAVQACLRDELQRAVGLADRKHFREAPLNPLIQAGWLTQTIPDKPNSRLQKYRLTEAGRAWLELS